MPIYATLTGRVGRETETKEGGNWTLHSFSVGVERYDSRKKETVTDWVGVTLWGSHWGPRLKVLRKGTLVTVSGTLTVEEFQQKDGIKRFSVKVNGSDFQAHRGGSGAQDDGPPEEPAHPALPKPPEPPPPAPRMPVAASDNDDLPF